MKPTYPAPRTPLLAVVLLAASMAVAVPLAGHAQAELVSSTDVTARYEIGALVKGLWQKIGPARPQAKVLAKEDGAAGRPVVASSVQVTPLPPLALTQAQLDELANIEPAAGHGEEASESGGHEAEAAGGHGSPHASGKTEGQKSFTGKVVGAPPPLPKVTIGGHAIISKAASEAAALAATLPQGLKGNDIKDFLDRRFLVTPYAHSPHRGDLYAQIKVVEFVDLSCGQCMPELAKIDAALQDVSGSVLVTHVHAPTARFQDTNMPAFYGKVADRGGVFWEYRANLIQDRPADSNAIFDELVKSGMKVTDARSMMMNEARRFYRELDADALLARSFGVSQPPVVFVNGIRVGEHGVPLEKLGDVLDYVDARIKRNLPEPPTK